MNEKRLIELYETVSEAKKELIRLYLHLHSLLHSTRQFVKLFKLVFEVSEQKNADDIRKKLEELHKHHIHYALIGNAYAFIGELISLFSDGRDKGKGLNVFQKYGAYKKLIEKEDRHKRVHDNILATFADITNVDLKYLRNKVGFHRDEKETITAYLDFLGYQKEHAPVGLDKVRIPFYNIVDIGITRSCFRDIEDEQLYSLLLSETQEDSDRLYSRLKILVDKADEIADCVEELCKELERAFE